MIEINMILNPCPFCGGQAAYTEVGNEHMGIRETKIKCKVCGTEQKHKWLKLRFEVDQIRSLTVKDWNRRVEK